MGYVVVEKEMGMQEGREGFGSSSSSSSKTGRSSFLRSSVFAFAAHNKGSGPIFFNSTSFERTEVSNADICGPYCIN